MVIVLSWIHFGCASNLFSGYTLKLLTFGRIYWVGDEEGKCYWVVIHKLTEERVVLCAGCIAFMCIAVYFTLNWSNKLEVLDKLFFGLYFAGTIICLGLSCAFHTLHCHSELVGRILNKCVIYLPLLWWIRMLMKLLQWLSWYLWHFFEHEVLSQIKYFSVM